ncbi:ABC transporter permease [Bacillus sp. FJAT-45350]|uniref:ABC transporter permease n=1 Tax=Bacillus sp. FJAT-45350 TaxID=2011014 RepID=UPI000BB79EC1|nr:ABC transporter permease [Bacillus sp. FJAT-45350]
MIRYSWYSIRNNFRSSLLFFCSLVAILIAGPICISVLFDIHTTVEDSIEQHSRGSYDILIRPEGTQTPVERALGKVEENYLTNGDGGITIDEWKKIKELEGVEIAAPVASVGYFTGENKTFQLDYPGFSSYIDLKYKTFDGVNYYPLSNKGGYYYFLEQHDYSQGYDYVEESGLSFNGQDMKAEFNMPLTYHLTVGVDREEEEKLTGIDLSALEKPIPIDLLSNYMDLEVGKHIPIIYLSDSFIPIIAEVTVSQLDWGNNQTLELKDQFNIQKDDPFFFHEDYPHTFLKELTSIEQLNMQDFEIDLSAHIRPFFYEPLLYKYDGTFSEPDGFSFGVGESSRYYHAKPINYDIRDGKTLEVKQFGKDSGVPTYRKIEERGYSARESVMTGDKIPFLLYPVGSFSTSSHQDSLAASPLGIYQQAPSTLNDGTMLLETVTPGSFVSSPAHGIMNLYDTTYIKGEAPIDAIRLRVGGIQSYNDDAIKKLNEIIIDVSQIGNFQIDIVAGASPSKMTMDVEGIGEVKQSWTSLGAAASISTGWNQTNLIIAGLFLTISILYFINNNLFKKQVRLSERDLLLDLGWQKRHIQKFYLLENTFLMIFAGLFSGTVVIGLYLYEVVNIYSFTSFLIILLLIFLISWTSTKRDRHNNFSTTNIIKFKSIWIKNLMYYRSFILLSFIQISLITLLFNFVPVSLFATNQLTGQTNLGEHVNSILVFSLIVILVASVYLTVSTIIESISSFLFIRKEEILTMRDIGWRFREVSSTFVKESIAWIVPSIMLGMLINILFISVMYTFSLEFLFITFVATSFLIFVALGIAITIVRNTLRKLV